jgi:2',3'-cyclic-nucleotide 2'-phosphodiesterase (5'-nucleotidase family)
MKISPVLIFFNLIVVSGFLSCHRDLSVSEEEFSFTILQINDVYEIEPVSGGELGGMARVAAIRKELMSRNENVLTVLAGDFLSPSFMGTLKYNGQRLSGKQMVNVLNATGIDYVTFGNHEFDISKSQLQSRINESRFSWISCNVKEITESGSIQAFRKVQDGKTEIIQPYIIHSFNAMDGKKIRLGMIGVTLPFNKADSIRYEDVYKSFKTVYDRIKDSCEVIVGLTHLDMEMDRKLAAEVPGLNLITGGHEHVNMKEKAGKVLICKADANAKSAYVHNFTVNKKTGKVTIKSQLRKIDSSVIPDKAVNDTVLKWTSFRDAEVERQGFKAGEVLMKVNKPLEGRELFVRSQPTNFTRLIASSMLYSFPSAEVAVFNSGSLRLDDQLYGNITQLDILRSLPYGGTLSLVKLSGTDLKKILNTGTADSQKGNGGFLQIAGADKTDSGWAINKAEISDQRIYTVIMPTFLSMGKETNLEFIGDFLSVTPERLENSIQDITYRGNDLRNSVIAYIRSGMKKPVWEDR